MNWFVFQIHKSKDGLIPGSVFILLLCSCAIKLHAQYSYLSAIGAWKNQGPGPSYYASRTPELDGISSGAMLQLSVKDLYAIKKEAHGIRGTIDQSGGYIKVSVLSYGLTKDKVPVNLVLYECIKSDGDVYSSGYSGKITSVSFGELQEWYQRGAIGDDNLNDAYRPVLSLLRVNGYDEFTISEGISEISIPVIVKIEVFKATAFEVKIPGIGRIFPSSLRPSSLDIQVVNAELTESNFHLELDVKKPISQSSPISTTVEISNIQLGYAPDNGGQLSTATNFVGCQGIFSTELSTDILRKDYANFFRNPAAIFGGTIRDYDIYARYDVTITVRENGVEVSKMQHDTVYQWLTDVYVGNGLLSYTVDKEDYNGLPVYKLSGGMSAEYAVQKALASLDGGISHTWSVANKSDGTPDYEGGGPLVVQPSAHFLKLSIQKTVDLYNQLGDTTHYETVIISVGSPTVPYLSSAMKAPILPLHFLVGARSVQDVDKVLKGAASDGLEAYAAMGFDPSIIDRGVAWIKLLSLPEEYKKFIAGHKVNNVILMGYHEETIGDENAASRILTAGSTSGELFASGAIYMMKIQNVQEYTSRIRDYNQHSYGAPIAIPDWEGGIANVQVNKFTDSLRVLQVPNDDDLNIYSIRTYGSGPMYRWAVNLAIKYYKKLGMTPQGITMNEYLIGSPHYEFFRGKIPFPYWQGSPVGMNCQYLQDRVDYMVSKTWPAINSKSLPVQIPSKADRTSIVPALSYLGYSALQIGWKKSDVWLLNQPVDPPCVIYAKDIVNTVGVQEFKNWNKDRIALDITDLNDMATASTRPPLPSANSHPLPANTSVIKDLSQDAGLMINRYDFAVSNYWLRRNFPNEVILHALSTSEYLTGYLDGEQSPPYARKQAVTIAQFNTSNKSDEYDLRIAYKFNVKRNEGLTNYDPAKGTEQNMGCFEFTSVPKNHWLDIPSRVMAREGATLILNGSVYDFDYNGIPGVVPFIKKHGTIKAQPQILSYKGEGAFAWNWGSNKKASILPRTIPDGSDIVNQLKNLFQPETSNYSNVLGGMTYMSGGVAYDLTALQPAWMKSWPELPRRYLVDGQRCYYAPSSRGCATKELKASVEEGWNNCTNLTNPDLVKKFSAVAYRQYPRIFDEVPNARTFIAIKENQLDIGIVDGDMGEWSEIKGFVPQKRMGMHNYELNLFYQYKGYDKLVNLDGGSSTQFWLNGRGPLQMKGSYILRDDNQGPYFSRLVSSFLMLVPRLHTDQIKSTLPANNKFAVIDNSHLNFNYVDIPDFPAPKPTNNDHDKDKAFICLSPSMDKINTNVGMIAGNFKIANPNEAEGAILFYMGEDTYYPDTGGLREVVPYLRNFVVLGVGKMQQALIDSLRVRTHFAQQDVLEQLELNDQSVYYIKMRDRKITNAYFIKEGTKKYIDGSWHSFGLSINYDNHFSNPEGLSWAMNFYFDGQDKGYVHTIGTYDNNYRFLKLPMITHAMIGAMNIDGRFLTGNAKLNVDNYVVFTDDYYTSYAQYLSSQLYSNVQLPSTIAYTDYVTSGPYLYDKTFALTFEETAGQHSFALDNSSLLPVGDYGPIPKFYGLNVNVTRADWAYAHARMSTKESALQKNIVEENVELVVFPNPAKDKISFRLNAVKERHIEYRLIDSQGQVLLHKHIEHYKSTNVEIDELSSTGAAAGVYYLQVQTANDTYVQKVILIH